MLSWGRACNWTPPPDNPKVKDPEKIKAALQQAMAAASNPTPTALGLATASPVVSVSASGTLCLALTGDGQVLGWGRGPAGGNDDVAAPTSLAQLPPLAAGSPFVQIDVAPGGSCLARTGLQILHPNFSCSELSASLTLLVSAPHFCQCAQSLAWWCAGRLALLLPWCRYSRPRRRQSARCTTVQASCSPPTLVLVADSPSLVCD